MPPVEVDIYFRGTTKLTQTDALNYAFHQHCDFCASADQPEPLCSVCKYMRLQHLIVCLGEKIDNFIIFLKPETTADNRISRIMRNKDCALCRILSKGMRSYGLLADQDEYSICILQCEGSLLYVSTHDEDEIPGPKFEIDISLNQTPSTAIKAPGSLVESRPLMRSLVNWVQIQEWIGQSHGPHQREISTLANMLEGFRLIDVNKRRLTFGNDDNLAPGGFVALSYVWGNNSASPENALMQSNKQALEADGGLKQLPRTIEDAITICKQLGRPYLWVDRFCIQQDEEQEKQRQMDAMADIFSAAEFTIINASGTDMNSPIPGVTEEREVFQSQAGLPGLVLTNIYPHNGWAVDASRWAKRGWTYQEAVLSKKRLFFTPLEVSFESDETSELGTSIPEDYYYKAPPEYRKISNMRKLRYDDECQFSSFARHLKGYTGRLLTDQSDILNAFMGIFKALYPGEEGLYGLPEPDFDRALLWNYMYPESPIPSREGFPSWSWASCYDKVDCSVTFVTTLVCWAYKDHTGELNAVRSHKNLQPRDNDSHGPTLKECDPQFHLLLAWWAGCIEATPPDDLETELEVSLSAYESYILERFPTVESIWNAIKGGRNVGLERFQDLNIGLKAEDQSIIDELRPDVLITRAQTASFLVQYQWTTCYFIRSLESPKTIGDLYLQPPSVQNTSTTIFEDIPFEVELMAVSLSTSHPSICSRYYKRLFQSVNESLHTGEDPQWPGGEGAFINVLAIERPEGSSFWRLVGSGSLWFSNWVSANRTFKTIALE